jgi:hypothetical protein
MTGSTQTFVEIYTSQSCLEFETRNANTLSVSTDLIYTAVTIRSTARDTDLIATDLSCRTIAVTRTGLSTGIVDTFFSFDTFHTGSSTSEALTYVSDGTSGAVDAIDHSSLTSHYRCGRAFKSKSTTAGQVMVDYRTDSIRTTNTLYFTRILTSILNTGLIWVTLIVVSTADITVTL